MSKVVIFWNELGQCRTCHFDFAKMNDILYSACARLKPFLRVGSTLKVVPDFFGVLVIEPCNLLIELLVGIVDIVDISILLVCPAFRESSASIDLFGDICSQAINCQCVGFCVRKKFDRIGVTVESRVGSHHKLSILVCVHSCFLLGIVCSQVWLELSHLLQVLLVVDLVPI